MIRKRQPLSKYCLAVAFLFHTWRKKLGIKFIFVYYKQNLKKMYMKNCYYFWLYCFLHALKPKKILVSIREERLSRQKKLIH